MNWQLARYLFGTGLATFADRLAQVQLLSTVVMSGPDGQGLGSNTLALLMPFVLFSYGFGALVDGRDNRKLLIITSALRGVLLIGIPTILMSVGATGIIIPATIFVLCTCTVICIILDFALVPRLLSRLGLSRSANAAVLLVNTTATLTALMCAPALAEIWLPQESLRVAALLYFLAMVIFWTLNRSLTASPTSEVDGQQDLTNLFRIKKGSVALFRLSFLAQLTHGIFFSLFQVFCIQNTQFNNAQALNIFATLATGFISGAIASLTFLRRTKPSHVLGYCSLASTIACLLFIAIGNNSSALRLFLLTVGTAGATTIISVNSLMQKEFSANVRGKVYGAILSLTAAVYTLTAVAVEQITIQYSALTIIKIICGAWLFCVGLAAVTSTGLKVRWHKLRRKRESKLSSKTA